MFLPSTKARTETSWPTRRSSTTQVAPASPNSFWSPMTSSTAAMASSLEEQTITPLPFAKPACFYDDWGFHGFRRKPLLCRNL